MNSQTVFITGAGRGIGLELTRILLKSGCRVVASSRTMTPELNSLQCEVLELDVTSDLTRLREEHSKLFPKGLDLLINNAGVMTDEPSFESVNLNEVNKCFEVNTLGCLKVTQALLPALKKAANPKVANITSRMGSIFDNTSGRYYAYRMSKAALNMFNKSFSVDYPQIVSVVLHPGWVKTRMGGERAPTQSNESAQGLLRVIDGLSKKDTGKFYDFRGQEIPW